PRPAGRRASDGLQPGQRPRPAGRRASNGLQPGCGLPERCRGFADLVLGGRRELRKAAEPVEFAPAGRDPGAGRGRLRGGQVPGPPGERVGLSTGIGMSSIVG
ncbi:MAG TPA: hypothetical protein VK162_15480, partial [Streptosporangiaceae bacterium]|nr:hypothetical protein [Streptosporangiaceae bacterium]